MLICSPNIPVGNNTIMKKDTTHNADCNGVQSGSETLSSLMEKSLEVFYSQEIEAVMLLKKQNFSVSGGDRSISPILGFLDMVKVSQGNDKAINGLAINLFRLLDEIEKNRDNDVIQRFFKALDQARSGRGDVSLLPPPTASTSDRLH